MAVYSKRQGVEGKEWECSIPPWYFCCGYYYYLVYTHVKSFTVRVKNLANTRRTAIVTVTARPLRCTRRTVSAQIKPCLKKIKTHVLTDFVLPTYFRPEALSKKFFFTNLGLIFLVFCRFIQTVFLAFSSIPWNTQREKKEEQKPSCR